jgi:glycosyltransferase involved in cell wall biosynthesis
MIQAEYSAKTRTCRVMILSDAIPNRNGVGTYYHDLMEHLQDRLGHVEMIPARANCVFKKNRVWIPLPGDNSQHLYIPNVLPILRQVKQVQPDVLIAPTLGPFALLARWISAKYNIPLVFGYHTSLTKLASLYWHGHFGNLTNWYLKKSSKVMFRRASAVIVNTDAMREEAIDMGAGDAQIMGTTIARPIMTTPIEPYDGEVRTVLYGGRLAKEKRVHTLAEAAKAHPELHFRIAGEGPLRKELEEAGRDCENLALLGWLDREELLTEIDRADIVVLPSQHESFGSIALEVMARGRLMLVSNQCGILRWPTLVPGLCVIQESESVPEAIQRIRDLAPEERKDIAHRALEATRNMNDLTMEEWLNLLESVRERA